MNKLPVKIDISEPNIFLRLYASSVQAEKPSKRAALVASTRRLIKSYLDTQNALTSLLCSNVNGLKGWIEKRKRANQLKVKLAHLGCRLQAWVSATIAGAIEKSPDHSLVSEVDLLLWPTNGMKNQSIPQSERDSG